MRAWATLVIAIAFAAHASAIEVPQPIGQMTVVAAEQKPYVFMKYGAPAGFFVEIVKEVAAKAAVRLDFQWMPWARAFEVAKNEAGTCAIPTAYLPERAPYFSWIRSFYRPQWQFHGLADTQLKIESMDDARKYKVGVLLDSAPHQLLARLGGFTLEPTNADAPNLAKLANHRIDLWAVLSEVAEQLSKQEQVAVKPLFTFFTGDMGIACSLKTDPALMARLQGAALELVASGRIAAIIRDAQAE